MTRTLGFRLRDFSSSVQTVKRFVEDADLAAPEAAASADAKWRGKKGGER